MEGEESEFECLIPIGSKETKAGPGREAQAIFKVYSLGVATNRDEWTYSFGRDSLEENARKLMGNYNSELGRFMPVREGVKSLDGFVNNDPKFIKWTDRLKKALKNAVRMEFDGAKIRESLYRPFVAEWLYFDHLLNQRRYQQHHFWPAGVDNLLIALNASPGVSAFYCLCTNVIPDLHFTGDSQCFGYYVYDEDGSNRRENITDWALEQYRAHYQDASISKWDIFHYVYAVLHHPTYRGRYAANLRRELPRIPSLNRRRSARGLFQADS